MSRALKVSAMRLAVALQTLLLGLMLSGAAGASDVPRLVVSIKPLHSLLAGLMQGIGGVQLLIDGDTAPWDFQPDAAQLQAIDGAALVVWSGPELEPGLAGTLASPGLNGRVFEVLGSDALKVLPARDDPGRRDPFYWLDSRNMLILNDVFAQQLIAIDPDRSPAYERNWQRVAEALSQIDRVMEFAYRDVSAAPCLLYTSDAADDSVLV